MSLIMPYPKIPVSLPTPPDGIADDDIDLPPERSESQEEIRGDNQHTEILKLLQLILDKLDALQQHAHGVRSATQTPDFASASIQIAKPDSVKAIDLSIKPDVSNSIPTKSVGDDQESNVNDAGTSTSSHTNLFARIKLNGIAVKSRTFIEIGARRCCINSLRSRMHHIYKQPWFEPLIVCIIFLNAMCMIGELQYNGIQLARSLRFDGVEGTPHHPPSKVIIFATLEWLFGTFFVLELIFKLFVKGKRFFRNLYDWIDLITVCSFVVERTFVVTSPLSFAWLRMFRLVRVFRLLRLVRTVEKFDHLYLMTTAIRGSASVLAWALLLLVTILMFVALVLSQFLHAFYFNVESGESGREEIDLPVKTEHEMKQRQKIYEYFGTWTRSMLSVFELTLANWPPICRMLTEEISEWFALVILFHKMTIGFAVVGVINGVFMQETFRVAATDDRIMIRMKNKSSERFRRNMWRLFSALDKNRDGTVTRAEFKKMGQDQEVKTWLASMDISLDDMDALWNLIDADHDEEVTYDELVRGIMRVRGSSRSMDLLNMMKKHDKSFRIISRTSQSVESMKFPKSESDMP